MFDSLKKKLSLWVDKAKEKIAGKAKLEEVKEEPKPVVKDKLEKKQEKKSSKKAKQREEIKEPEIEEQEKEEVQELQETKKVDIIEKIIPPKKTNVFSEFISKPKEQEKKPEMGFFARLKSSFSYKITEEDFKAIFEDLEILLLENNVALEVVEAIEERLEKELLGKEIKKDFLGKEINKALEKTLEEIIIDPDDILEVIKGRSAKPFKILFFGINGTGKTTSIAKLGNLLKQNKISFIFAAADTFRAASIEQLQTHADRLGAKVIKQGYGADPSAVAFDAIEYAKAHKIDVVLIDTAGRMHTKGDLIREMEKIVRVSKPDLKVFVAEAIAGNDATEQARVFNDAIQIDGSILSKADIDEKGGTIISISYITKKPIFYLGTGQEYKDLKPFNKKEFIDSLGLTN